MEPRVGAHKVAVIGGDGIGPEVVAEALKVAAAAGVVIETVDYDLGAGRYERTGEVLPDSVLDELRDADAILLGAVGPPIGSTTVPPGVIERGLLLRLRFELDLYINLRPFNGVPGSIASDADFVVVRENTEGPYAGEGGALRRGTPFEVATQGSVNTRHGVERCVRYAFGLAERRETSPCDPRAQDQRAHLCGRSLAAGVRLGGTRAPRSRHRVQPRRRRLHRSLSRTPTRYDVVVTDNLFGDILADLAGAVTGGIGLAASANLNPARTGPSLFEPVHGAAYDIVGTGKANPLAAIRSAAMMLEHLGEVAAAERVTKAVLELQTEMAGSSEPWSTAGVGDAVIRRL